MIKYYRKKPVVISAIQFDGTFTGSIRIKLAFPELQTLSQTYHQERDELSNWKIGTLEGGHYVSKGDFVIKGVKGEFYPCKPEIFELTYDLIETI